VETLIRTETDELRIARIDSQGVATLRNRDVLYADQYEILTESELLAEGLPALEGSVIN